MTGICKEAAMRQARHTAGILLILVFPFAGCDSSDNNEDVAQNPPPPPPPTSGLSEVGYLQNAGWLA
jgi:hypothetical protein